MNKLEEMFLTRTNACKDDLILYIDLTKDIALKYLNFIEDECYYFSGEWCLKGEDDMITKEELFNKFLETL